MKLFIKTENGVAVSHPILEENMRQLFPDFDPSNLPDGFSDFVRLDPPALGIYEVFEGTSYVRSGNSFTDRHNVRDMTADEKKAKQDIFKEEWADFGFQSWVFDDELFKFVPPVQKPSDGNNYIWEESSLSWVLAS